MTLPSFSFSICVLCGVSSGPDPSYPRTVGELGEILGRRGHQLVYGAGGIGLMGMLARGAVSTQGDVAGVIPHFLRSREIGDDLPPQTVVLTDDLVERKRNMIERSDAYIALPGGYGTLDEVLEVASMAALGLPVGPLVLVDVANDWASLFAMVDDILARGFVRRTDLFHLVSSPLEAVELVERLLDSSGTAVGTR
ncbi:TIGR00730 family Rossman fold protein [Kutzneria viridogrisea]